ncbi:ribosome maturation protein RimP [Sphingobium nicotianae]|uniref:Ribosome maturation factor RimP n=1 Tax=Sphingobium nicotianae TaxID=2782607 RepID=A0A9X1IS73_9SPHN|nr:ribosome maturation protein RimP [Sphingobium nicotianae]MBT2188127.1 ribosome maturation protein RimP [Sphingobium nicotianae]
MADMEVLNALVDTEAKALGFDLVRVAVFGKGEEQTLQIMAERPDTRQLTIDDCADLSRRVSDRLDALEEAGKDPIEGAYRLEVSSPGIDRPLTRLRDFADWAGHEARVSFAEPVDGRKQVKAVLAGVDGATVLLDDPKSGRIAIDFSNVASAKLVLTDALISATVPLSTEGADDIVTQEQED